MSDPGEHIQLWQAPYFEPPAPLQAEIPLEESHAVARASGFQSGREEGLAQGLAEANEIVTRMAAVADELAQPFRGLDAQVARELARVAMLLAQQIVRRELTIDSTVVADIVTEAMSTLYKLDGELVVFLNPADAACVRELTAESGLLDGKSWKIVEDDSLSPGGCQVKTPTSFVDGSVERQMEVIFAKLIESCDNLPES